MSFIISKVLPEDIHEYVACGIACWQSAYKGIVPDDYLENMPNETERRIEKTTKYMNEATEHFYYCVKSENKIIGFVTFGKSWDEDKPAAGEIGAIYLLEEFWNKGYGRQMMEYGLKNLKDMGYHEIVVWVFEENYRSRRFYEKFGFVLDGAKKERENGKTLITVRYVLKL